MLNINGAIADIGNVSSTVWDSGRGGGSIFGPGGTPVQGSASSGSNGNPSLSPGGGGSGGTNAHLGGGGANGLVAIWG
jgi:hypothetical protein